MPGTEGVPSWEAEGYGCGCGCCGQDGRPGALLGWGERVSHGGKVFRADREVSEEPFLHPEDCGKVLCFLGGWAWNLWSLELLTPGAARK